MTIREELRSQQHVYNQIAKTHRSYPYSTAHWAVRALRPYFDQLPSGSKILEIGCNEGASSRVLLTEIQTNYPDKLLYYTGVDISDIAIHQAVQKDPRSNKLITTFRHGDIFDVEHLDTALEADLRAANLIVAIYVGPSVGLRTMLRSLVANKRPFVIVDRVYESHQATHVSLSSAVPSILGFIQYFRENHIPFPYRGFFRQLFTKPIYFDPNYISDAALYAKNAPGSFLDFNEWLTNEFGGTVKISGRFGTDTIFVRNID